MTRPDPFDLNAQPKPPDRKAAEIKERITGGEGYAIIGTNGVRQTTFLEQSRTSASGTDLMLAPLARSNSMRSSLRDDTAGPKAASFTAWLVSCFAISSTRLWKPTSTAISRRLFCRPRFVAPEISRDLPSEIHFSISYSLPARHSAMSSFASFATTSPSSSLIPITRHWLGGSIDLWTVIWFGAGPSHLRSRQYNLAQNSRAASARNVHSAHRAFIRDFYSLFITC